MMNNYEVFSGKKGNVEKTHSREINHYKEAEQEMLDEFDKPDVKEVLIMKDGEPFEYMSDRGRFRL